MMIFKITPSVDYTWWLKRLYTQLNEPINQNSVKVPKVVEPMNKNQENFIIKVWGLYYFV